MLCAITKTSLPSSDTNASFPLCRHSKQRHRSDLDLPRVDRFRPRFRDVDSYSLSSDDFYTDWSPLWLIELERVV